MSSAASAQGWYGSAAHAENKTQNPAIHRPPAIPKHARGLALAFTNHVIGRTTGNWSASVSSKAAASSASSVHQTPLAARYAAPLKIHADMRATTTSPSVVSSAAPASATSGASGASMRLFAQTAGGGKHLLGDSIISVPPSLGASYEPAAGRNINIQTIPPPIVGVIPPNLFPTGANVGNCNQVYAGQSNNVLQFRTLCAGPNVTIQQDFPGAGDILISSSGGTIPSPPQDLSLYVSALGNDVTGLGSFAFPYATIQRAAEQVRVTGYNVTATISVIDTSASGAYLTLENTVVDLSTGPFGLQQYPLILQGVSSTGGFGRATVRTDTVSSSTIDPASQNWIITAATGGFTSAQPGQIVRFTSGADVTNIPLQAFGPPTLVDVETFIGKVTTNMNPSDTLTVSLAGPTPPAPGDGFIVEQLTTAVKIVGVAAFVSPSVVTLYNLDFLPGAGGVIPFAIMAMIPRLVFLVGVNFRASPDGSLIVVTSGSQASILNGANLQPPATSPSTNSMLGMALLGDTMTSNIAQFVASVGGLTSQYSNSILLGFPTGPSGSQIAGASMSLSSIYATGFSNISITEGGESSVNNALFDDVPTTAINFAEGSLSMSRMHFNNTATSGFSPVCNVSGFGILQSNGDVMFTGCGILVSTSASAAVNLGSIAIGSCSALTTSPMFNMSGGSFMQISQITGLGGGAVPASVDLPLLSASEGSYFVLGTALTYAPTRAGAGNTVSLGSRSAAIFQGGLTISGGASTGVSVDDGSSFSCGTNSLSVTGFTAGAGIFMTNQSSMVAGGITATGNSGGVSLSASAIAATGAITTSNCVGVGLFMDAGSKVVTTSGSITSSGTSSSGIVVIGDSRLINTSGDIIASGTTSPGAAGLSIVGSTVYTFGNITAVGNGGHGIDVVCGSLLAPNGSITATSNAGNNINAVQAPSPSGMGAQSMIYSGDTITADSTLDLAGSNSCGIQIANTALSAGALSASNCGGAGFIATGGSRVYIVNTLTANSNQLQGLLIDKGSSFFCQSITANTNVGTNQTANVMVWGGSSLSATSITANGSTGGFGVWALASTLAVGDTGATGTLTATGNQLDNLLVQASNTTIVGSGILDGSITGTGFSMGYSQSGGGGPITPIQSGGTLSFTGGVSVVSVPGSDVCFFMDEGKFEATQVTLSSSGINVGIAQHNSSFSLISQGVASPITCVGGTGYIVMDTGSNLTIDSAVFPPNVTCTAVGLTIERQSSAFIRDVTFNNTAGGPAPFMFARFGSKMYFEQRVSSPPATILGQAPAVGAQNLISCDTGSTMQFEIMGLSQVAVSATNGSRIIFGSSSIDCSAGAPTGTPSNALIDIQGGSTITAVNSTVTGSGGGAAGQDGIRVEFGSHGFITATEIDSCTNNGLTVDTGSDVTANNLTTTVANGGFGAQVMRGSKLMGQQMNNGSPLTGAGGDLQIGGKAAANTWASVIGQPPITAFASNPPDSTDWGVGGPNCQNCQAAINS